MKLFKRTQLNRRIDQKSYAVADCIAKTIIGKQRTIADYLYRKTQYWNKTSKLIALILFCLLFGGFSLYLLTRVFI